MNPQETPTHQELSTQKKLLSLPFRPLSYEERYIISEALPTYSDLDQVRTLILPEEALKNIELALSLVVEGTSPPRRYFGRIKVYYNIFGSIVVVGIHTPDPTKSWSSEVYLIYSRVVRGGESLIDLIPDALSNLEGRLSDEKEKLEMSIKTVSDLRSSWTKRVGRCAEIVRRFGRDTI